MANIALMFAAAAVAVALALTVPSAAEAFTVEVTGTAPDKVLTVTSDGASSVKVFENSAGQMEVARGDFADPSEPITKGEGCSGEPWWDYALCGPPADIANVVFQGGQDADRFVFFAPPRTLPRHHEAYGGGGADWLSAGGDPAMLDGGAGADSLFGGSADDELLGGEDVDTLYGGRGSDLLDGGAASDAIWGDSVNEGLDPPNPSDVDLVDYGARTAAVTVRLLETYGPAYTPGEGGEPGEDR